ncbi:MAG: protein-export chaperone SecB [Rhodobacteraceae bacterium]|nr:protein-export chaperone SecB [Paracoccaceae bacterium]
MAERNNDTAPARQKPVSMKLVNQYIRDLSFENVAALKGLGGKLTPEVQVQVNLDANRKGENAYVVALKLTVDAKSSEQQVFLLEVDYAGDFQIENVPEEQMHPFLMIECPRMLFPFVRQIARNMTADGGYPPINIENIDFLALYRNELARRKKSKTGTAQT